jgi:ABC-type amino acid transport substrate-binding protein
MALLTEPDCDARTKGLLWGIGAVAFVALILSIIALLRPMRSTQVKSPDRTDALSYIANEGILRVGYGGFPPYTVIDPKETDANKRVKGFSVDLVNEIARRNVPPLRVEWNNLNWDTLKTDLLSGKFDFVADPVFQTIPRGVDFGLCEPYSYFGIAVAIVRKNETRFKSFEDLDREDITIALAAGWTSSEYAHQNLTKPQFKSIPVSGDAFNQLDEVLLGRADVALNDVPTVVQYARAHSDKVKALWIESPPSRVPGAFLTRKADTELKAFLDSAIRILTADGSIKRLDEKWKTYGFIPLLQVLPGNGLAIQPVTTQVNVLRFEQTR